MIRVDISVCDECGTCISVCPENALLLVDLLSIDESKCISCGNCVAVCPYGALHILDDEKAQS